MHTARSPYSTIKPYPRFPRKVFSHEPLPRFSRIRTPLPRQTDGTLRPLRPQRDARPRTWPYHDTRHLPRYPIFTNLALFDAYDKSPRSRFRSAFLGQNTSSAGLILTFVVCVLFRTPALLVGWAVPTIFPPMRVTATSAARHAHDSGASNSVPGNWLCFRNGTIRTSFS
jgi:hypothetical protein